MGATTKMAAGMSGGPMNGMFPSQMAKRPLQAVTGQNAPQPAANPFGSSAGSLDQAIAGGGGQPQDPNAPHPFHNSISDFMSAHAGLAGGFASMLKNFGGTLGGSPDGGSAPAQGADPGGAPGGGMQDIMSKIAGTFGADPNASKYSMQAHNPMLFGGGTPPSGGNLVAQQNQVGPMMGNGFQPSAPVAPNAGTSPIQQLSHSTLNGDISSVNTNPSDIGGLRQQLVSSLGNNMGGIQAQNGQLGPAAQMAGVGNVHGQQNDVFNADNLAKYGISSPFQTVTPQSVSSAGTQTQSIDQLGGANSEFFKNMMAQYQPAFAQQRATDLASAKEAAGNLTGSGFANALGNTINRSLGAEQKQLADVGAQGVGMETQRQQYGAGLANQRNMADASNSLQGQIANQGTQAGFMQQLLGQATGNQQNNLQAQLANQQTKFNTQQGNANLQQQNAIAGYQGQNAINQSNAGNLTGLLGQIANTGVGPNQVVQQNGLGALAGPAGSLIGQLLSGVGGPNGSPLTNGLGSLAGLIGGGGADGQGNFGALGDLLGKLGGGGGGGSNTQSILDKLGLPGVSVTPGGGVNKLTGGGSALSGMGGGPGMASILSTLMQPGSTANGGVAGLSKGASIGSLLGGPGQVIGSLVSGGVKGLGNDIGHGIKNLGHLFGL